MKRLRSQFLNTVDLLENSWEGLISLNIDVNVYTHGVFSDWVSTILEKSREKYTPVPGLTTSIQ